MPAQKVGASTRDAFRTAGIEKGDHVLDVGFRDLSELRAIAKRVGSGGTVVGIDNDPMRVGAALEELGSQPPGIMVELGSLLDIPYANDRFDVVLCKGVLHEVRRVDAALKEMARVCKPGGTITIIDMVQFSRVRFEAYRWGARVRGRRTGDVHPGFSHSRLRRLLEHAELEEEHYEVIPSRWRLGFNWVKSFVLRARSPSLLAGFSSTLHESDTKLR